MVKAAKKIADKKQAPKKNKSMSPRERFQRTMHYQSVDRIPNFEFGYWEETLDVWHQQGLPAWVKDEATAYQYFGIESCEGDGIQTNVYPYFEERILEKSESHVIMIDANGVTCEINRKKGMSSIPHFIEFPIKGPADWKEFKKTRLDPHDPGRYPKTWKKDVEGWINRKVPVGIDIGSMIGKPRDWMGFENITVAFYDQPELMAEMIEYMGDFICALIEPALKEVQFDFAHGWEDVAFKNGPMISPAMYRQYVLPQYKKISRLLHKYGIDVIYTDCDGDINLLVPIFLEAGYNCMFPMERACGTDPVKLRAKYGDQILLWGGVDKIKIQGSFKDIDDELRYLEATVKQGGFVPGFDHRCPPTVPLKNYEYYLKQKKKIFNC